LWLIVTSAAQDAGASVLVGGTQDLYPDFLKSAHGLAHAAVSNIAILYNLCAIAGALLFGHFSERLGRRHTSSRRWESRLSLCTPGLLEKRPWFS